MQNITIYFQDVPVVAKKNGDTVDHLAWCLNEVFTRLKTMETEDAKAFFRTDMELAISTRNIYQSYKDLWTTKLNKLKAIYDEESQTSATFIIDVPYNGELRVVARNIQLHLGLNNNPKLKS